MMRLSNNIITTKENEKGYTRSYHYYKRHSSIFLPFILLIIITCITWHLLTVAITREEKNVVGRILNHPIHNIDYGVQSTTPLVFIQSKLDNKLHQRFLQEYINSCTEDELNSSIIPGLDNRVNKPVYVYEGYYHSLPTSSHIYSKNPNPMIGIDFDKLAATPFTRAFYVALREVNVEIFDTLRYNLLQASSYYHNNNNNNNSATNNEEQEEEKDVCYILANWIEKGHHFGDLSIQIHYGKGNEQKLKSGAAWHTDAENSLLHLAITLRGSRTLHSKRIRIQSNSTTLRARPKNSRQEPTEILTTQKPRDIYLSSSTLMRHAPQFFDTNYDARVIAIHARILYTSDEVNHFRKVRTKESWDKLTNVLAETLSVAELRIPSLEQVEQRVLWLEQQQRNKWMGVLHRCI